MANSSVFYTASENVLSRKVESGTAVTDRTKLDEIYQIERTQEWIDNGKFKRIALQFPDELMRDAVKVVDALQKSLHGENKVFILGDTSYGSCCVDEVAAQHYNAEALVHYGRSCLSQPCKMPVLFVYGCQSLDVQDCGEKFCLLFPDTESNVIIMYDTVYEYACDDLLQSLRTKYKNVVMTRLAEHNEESSDNDTVAVKKCGRSFILPQNAELSNFSVFYIGSESLTMTNLFYNFPACQFFTYNPLTKEGRQESVNVNKMLMKRYFLIEKAKDARIVGILVGTLGVSNYLDILNRLKVLIRKAGKKSYTFLVGKINVAKLANFMEIDVFVLIACAENSLLDSSEFYKPVVTPYEMELACNTEREWTGDYPTDFHQLLEGGSHHMPIPENLTVDETDISLVTGKIRNTGFSDKTVETGSSVVLRSDALSVAIQADSAGEYLSQRSWQGLEQKLGETAVTKAIQGQKGIAMGYTTEPKS